MLDMNNSVLFSSYTVVGTIILYFRWTQIIFLLLSQNVKALHTLATPTGHEIEAPTKWISPVTMDTAICGVVFDEVPHLKSWTGIFRGFSRPGTELGHKMMDSYRRESRWLVSAKMPRTSWRSLWLETEQPPKGYYLWFLAPGSSLAFWGLIVRELHISSASSYADVLATCLDSSLVKRS